MDLNNFSLEKLEKILESPVKIEAQYSDLDENLVKLAKFEHEYKQQERQHDVLVECRDGQTRLLTGQAQLKTPKDRSMKFEMKTETENSWLFSIIYLVLQVHVS